MALLVAALLSAAFGTLWVLFGFLPSFNTPATLASGVPHQRSTLPVAPRIGRRVVLLVVDGLGFESAKASPGYRVLRNEGAFRELVADYPTFTAPAITAMFVGQEPAVSGVRLNGAHEGALGLDNVLSSAWDAGVYVEVRSRTFPEFVELVRPPPQADIRRGRWAALLDLVAPPKPTSDPASNAEWLRVVHFGEVDDRGHECGSDCESYHAATEHSAAFARKVADTLDRQQDLLLVLSDHGMRESSGHGGDEAPTQRAFLLAWGANVARGSSLDPRPMQDVTSTVAVAVGAQCPASNLGAPMLDLFELDDTRKAQSMANCYDAIARYGCTLTPLPGCVDSAEVAAGLATGGGDVVAAQAFVGELWAARIERTSQGYRPWARAGGVGLVMLLLGWTLRRRLGFVEPRAFRGALLLVLTLVVPYGVVLRAMGYEPTLSAMAGTEYFLPDATQAALLAAVLTIAVAWRASEPLQAAAQVLFGCWLILGPVFAHAGLDPTRIAPPLSGTLTFQLGPLSAAAALVAFALVGQDVRAARRKRVDSVGPLGSEREREGSAAGESKGLSGVLDDRDA